MILVLLKTKNQKTTRYRLFEINGSSIEQLSSELNLPEIIREIIRLDCPIVHTKTFDLPEKIRSLISTKPKLAELDKNEKYRYENYLTKFKKTGVL